MAARTEKVKELKTNLTKEVIIDMITEWTTKHHMGINVTDRWVPRVIVEQIAEKIITKLQEKKK